MEKTYSPQDIESKWYQTWEQQGYFKPGTDPQADPYCIMIPPPNVTGSLHMGHGFQEAIMDALIRYHRMLGNNTLWQVGTDHAGIATQMVVERLLEAEGVSRHDLGREKFIEKVWPDGGDGGDGDDCDGADKVDYISDDYVCSDDVVGHDDECVGCHRAVFV